ncbi:uncharacterized protein LOC107003772 [Solanum pennellii]|uniref:Uncharacterized protein LOC107003772 n=1 Tax=Solanum pennellii TaxID=28526 RepID=A0ABM1FIZ7_SOLPN|nr:uncharacterized protein LOC107003772 [Solanum pennellii]
MEKVKNIQMELTEAELQRKIERITREIQEAKEEGLRVDIATAIYKAATVMLDEDLASQMKERMMLRWRQKICERSWTLVESESIEARDARIDLEIAMPTENLAKWQMLLSEFDTVYVTQKAIKAEALADYLAENPYVQKLCKRFRKIEFRHTPRIQNELADALSTIASMIKHPDTDYIDPLDIELKEHPVYYSHVEAEPDGLPWYFDIKRRTPYLGLLRCVDAVEAVKLIEQIHAGVCGTHMNGLTLDRKILRAGYFCMTMENDCCSFVQKCHRCQVHGDLIRVPPHELNAMSSPRPFVAWRMDVIGPIEPSASNGHKFIFVAVDYFTKWVEATSYKFGVTESIITDNGANIKSYLMREICEQFKITHRNSTAYRPQINGAVEVANKNIKKILRKMIDKHRGLHEMLPYALLGYCTTVRTSIGATPYLLVYGTEAVIPAEVEILFLRIIQEAELSNAEWRVRARNFEVGQLVLKRICPHQDEYKGKFTPNWQGPYMVRKVLSGGALVLAEMDSTVWPKPINSDAVKRYYV